MGDCDRQWEVDAYREGRLGQKDAQSFERHVKVCSACRSRKDGDEHLRTLALALPQDPPSELALRRLRTRILRDVATGASPREPLPLARMALVAALVLAALGGGWWALRRPAGPPQVAATSSMTATPAEALAGSVTAGADARWTQARQDGVERITLEDGALAVHVRHQQVAERFLVVLPDGELEVRGTTFEVSVSGGSTMRVQVEEGLVELRLRGRPVARLGAGESWTPPAPPSPAATVATAEKPAIPRAVPSASGDRPIAPSVLADDGAAAYADALALLRAGRGDDAAAAFQSFLLGHPGAPQVEDASFLEAVALARAGRTDAAGLAAEHHLASFPGSFHRKEAAILVARAASQRGDCARVRAVLAPWLGASPDDDARAALGACPSP
jgi:TolA-binding protein